MRNALSRCDIRYEEVTFVDVGCGESRVLLMAAEFPFRQIVGVDASETLCDIAWKNVRTASGVRDGFENRRFDPTAPPQGGALLHRQGPAGWAGERARDGPVTAGCGEACPVAPGRGRPVS